MRISRIALLALASALAFVPTVKADEMNLVINGTTATNSGSSAPFSADLTLYFTATPNQTNEQIWGVSGTITAPGIMGGTLSIPFPILSSSVVGQPLPMMWSGFSTTSASNCAKSAGTCYYGGSGGGFYFDNLLNPTGASTPGLLDWGGLLLEVPGLNFNANSANAYLFNLFESNGNWYWADNGSYHWDDEISVTPEPGSLLLLGTGLLILAVVVFRTGKQRSHFVA